MELNAQVNKHLCLWRIKGGIASLLIQCSFLWWCRFDRFDSGYQLHEPSNDIFVETLVIVDINQLFPCFFHLLLSLFLFEGERHERIFLN